MPTLARARKMLARNRPNAGHGVLDVNSAVALEALALEVVDHRAGHLLEVLPVQEWPVLHAHQMPAHPEDGVLARLQMDVGRAKAHGLPQDAGELHRSSPLLPEWDSDAAGRAEHAAAGLRADSFSSPVPVEVKVCGGARKPVRR